MNVYLLQIVGIKSQLLFIAQVQYLENIYTWSKEELVERDGWVSTSVHNLGKIVWSLELEDSSRNISP